jgi:general nucleoside transport system ATP-binding protein
MDADLLPAPVPDPAAHLSLRGITKRFGQVLANDAIDLDVQPGEFLGLLGENGAGKSTLMNILAGVYHPDAGGIWLRGRRVTIAHPRQAAALGIGMVHQHFTLIPELTVAENILLGLPARRGVFTDLASAGRRIREMSHQYGLEVDPSAPVWQLPVGAQQRVEILKVLYRGAGCLILDEPTAVLTPEETAPFLAMLGAMTQAGTTILFVSHKLYEVQCACQRVVILRAGRVVANARVCDTDKRQIARWMVGQDVSLVSDLRPTPRAPGDLVLEARGLASANDRGLQAFCNVDLDVHEGEIVGLAGVAGNGQNELVECLAGLRPVAAGHLRLAGQDITGRSPAARRAAGLAYVPEDRKLVGCVLDMRVDENLILGAQRTPEVARHGWLRMGEIASLAARKIAEYQIKAPGPASPARLLSGGNLQKLILAREMGRRPRLLVAAEPTRGLDVGATEYTHRQLLALRDSGCALLLISTDLDEILALSDRVLVMHRGMLLGPVDPGLGREGVGHIMLTGKPCDEGRDP